MNVVYALTRNYYYKIFPSIKSLIEHNPKAKVYILCEDDEYPYPLPCDATIINVSGQTWFPTNGINYHNYFSYINLLRVCYPMYLKCNKVIHLDVDTIVCESLEPMWRTDLKGKWFGACSEVLGKYHPFGPTYYNMGVAVINLQQMRTDGIVPTMVKYLNTVPQMWADQDAWNKYGLEQGKTVTLDTRWNENCMTGYTETPAIVHYTAVPNWFEATDMFRIEYLRKYRDG